MVPQDLLHMAPLLKPMQAVVVIANEELTEVLHSSRSIESMEKLKVTESTSDSTQVDGDPISLRIDLLDVQYEAQKRSRTAMCISCAHQEQGKRICMLFDWQKLKTHFDRILDDGSVSMDSEEFIRPYLGLSHREREVALLIAKGRSSRQIGKELHIAENTVKNHRKRLRKNLGFDNKLTYRAFLDWLLTKELTPDTSNAA